MSLAPPSSSTAMSSYNNTSLSTALCSYRCSPRITKENLFMVLALWMEYFPVESEAKDNEDKKLPYSGHRKVGAVLVLPGADILYAVDCTRDGVHAVARLLMKHPDITEGCKVFVSRKPCSFCTKLLVQSKVERVYFPPFEPEFHGVLKFTSKELKEFLEEFTTNSVLPVASQINVPANSNEDPSALEMQNYTRKRVLEKLKSDGVLDDLTSKLEKSSRKLEELISDKAVTLALEQFDREKLEVDNLFTRSTVGQSVLMPKVEETVLQHEKKNVLQREKKKNGMDSTRNKKMKELYERLSKEEWIKTKKEEGIEMSDEEKRIKKKKKEEWIKTMKDNLSWLSFDGNMANKLQDDLAKTIEWMTLLQVESASSFQPVVGEEKPEELQSEQFAHLIGMAQFLARRTDDPRTGVGAVIANENMEIKALGWNGFPLKALYGEFPRASSKDEVKEKKFPFVIHAEQNAFLMRNNKKLGKDATLFVTRTPCDECTPLIQMQGIKTVVLGQKMERDKPGNLSYEKFPQSVKKGVFTCFEMKPPPSKSPSLPSSCYFNCCCGFCF